MMDEASQELPTSLADQLRQVYPFRFLAAELRNLVVHEARLVEAGPGEILYRRGDPDDSVWVIFAGAVELVDARQDQQDRVMVVTEQRYFGEWEAIFRHERGYTARVRQQCRCLVLPGERFRQILRRSPACAQGFGTALRHDRGIFSPFDRFLSHLQQQADGGHIDVDALLPLYRTLAPAIHPGTQDAHRLDVAGLLYAVRRLPHNITSTFAILLVDEIPPAFDDPVLSLPRVATDARRRDVREMLPGKNLVLLRSGRSDLIDLVTCLCLYAVEARKIRERLTRDGLVGVLEVTPRETAAAEVLGKLSFSSREAAGLLAVWGEQTPQRLREILRHREMFSIHLRRQRRVQTLRRGEVWTSEVARATRQLVGADPVDLPRDRAVHIVSSNSHSVTNCLNPWFHANRDRLLKWAGDTGHPVLDETWPVEEDRLYALARGFFRENPEAEEQALRTAEAHGHLRVHETAGTGIQVQLIDLGALSGAQYDSLVDRFPASRNDLIVNIDYAFGQQAEFIIRNLLMLFGSNIRSVSFLGKAGALVGQRGDILVPTAFVEQQSDHFQPIPTKWVEGPFPLLEHHAVHQGPMLTVEGTLLQNRRMLTFYREIWDVIAMEMEGTHYYRKILEFQQLGVVPSAIPTRFMYYISDLPLEESAGLTAPMALREGVPPLYAITRTILNGILSGGSL